MKKDKLLKIGALSALAVSISVVSAGCQPKNNNPVKPVNYEITISDDDAILDLTEGDTVNLTAALDGYEGTAALNFIWSSNNEGVVTVSNGVITAVSEGSATITVALQYESKVYTKEITVNVAAAPIVYTLGVSDTAVTLDFGETKTVTASINDVSHPVFTWVSDDESVVTVENGVFSYVGAGTATVTVSITVDGQTYSKTISVTANEKPIEYSVAIDDEDAIIDITEGETATVTATLEGYEGTEPLSFVWRSSNTNVATVSRGVITAVSEGTATVTVSIYYDGAMHSKTITVNVAAKPIVYTLGVDKESVTLGEGDSATVIASINDVTDPEFSWESADTDVATVEDGVITFVGAGKTTVTVSITVDGQTYSKTIAVSAYALSVSNTAVTLGEDDTASVTATLAGYEGSALNYFWSSDKTTVATVNDGEITAVGTGLATITVATQYGGKVYSKTVTVNVYALNVSKESVTLGVDGTASVTAELEGYEGSALEFAWQSSNTDVATVEGGVITAVAQGSATITASVSIGGKQFSKDISVNVYTLSVNKQTVTLDLEDNATVSATLNGYDGALAFAWESSDTDVATVENGVITAVGKGSATITVSVEYDGTTYSADFAVNVYTLGVSAAAVSLDEGETATVSATLEGYEGDLTYNWASNNVGIATVSDAGVITAISTGSATITASATVGDKTFNKTIAVSVYTLNLNKESATLDIDEAATVTASLKGYGGSEALTFVWESDNEDVATVEGGVITAKGVGSATITASVEYGGKTYSKTVTVNVYTLTVSESVTLDIGDTASASATLTGYAGELTYHWSSNDNNVATVSDAGVITAKGVGATTITVIVQHGGKTYSKEIAVNVYTLDVSAEAVTLDVDDTATITPTLDGFDGSPAYTWVSDNEAVATVDGGELTAVGVGSATITVSTSLNGKNYSKTITVNVYTLTLSASTATLDIGDDATVTATLNGYEDALTYGWASSDTDVATVDGGVITAVGTGSATITASVTVGGKTYSKTVAVNVYTLGASEESATLDIDEAATVTASLKGYGGSEALTFVWESDNEDVATVAGGVITAHSKGSATITVSTTVGGKTYSKTIAVNVYTLSVSDATATLDVGETASVTASLNGYAGELTYVWNTSAPLVATVDGGEITAHSTGSATITVSTTVDGKEFSKEISVNVYTLGVSKTTVALENGGSATVTANLTGYTGSPLTYVWASDDTDVATVDGGVITAVGTGSATITVSVEYAGKTYSKEIAVNVDKLAVDGETNFTLDVGESETITASISDVENPVFTWVSSDEDVATVVDGVITAVGNGTATVTVSINVDAQTYSKTITVNVYSLSVTKETAVLDVDEVENVSATLLGYQGDLTYTWSSSNTNVATVSNGAITAKGVGTSTITVLVSGGGRNYSKTIEVTVYALDVSAEAVTLDIGDDATITASLSGYTGAPLTYTWVSDDESVATVVDGAITAVSTGSATITVSTTVGGKTYNKDITVNVYTLNLNKDAVTLRLGIDTFNVEPTLEGYAGTPVYSWSSSNTDVATVSDGVITTVGAGSATITASTTIGGWTYYKTVAVSVHALSVNKDAVTLDVDESETITAELLGYEGEALSFSWASSDTDVVEVDGGEITAVGVGSATVTVAIRYDGKNYSKTITVNVYTLELSVSNATLGVGDTVSVSADLDGYDDDLTYTWQSSSNSVATVSNAGVITAISTGSATVTASATVGGKTYSKAVTINVYTLTVDDDAVSLGFIGDTATITPTLNGYTGAALSYSWQSSNTNAVTVSDGVVTAVDVGNATVTVSVTVGGKVFSKDISVTASAKQVNYTFDYDSFEIYGGAGKEGKTIIAPDAIPEKESSVEFNYTFIGWFVKVGGVITDTQWDFATDTLGSEDLVLAPKFSASTRSYTVKINGVSSEAEYGSLLTRPFTDPTKASTTLYIYTFDDWYVADSNGDPTSTKWNFASDTVTGEVNIVPKFTQDYNPSATFKASVVINVTGGGNSAFVIYDDEENEVKSGNLTGGSVSFMVEEEKKGLADAEGFKAGVYTIKLTGNGYDYIGGKTFEISEDAAHEFGTVNLNITMLSNPYSIEVSKSNEETVSMSVADYGTDAERLASIKYTYTGGNIRSWFKHNLADGEILSFTFKFEEGSYSSPNSGKKLYIDEAGTLANVEQKNILCSAPGEEEDEYMSTHGFRINSLGRISSGNANILNQPGVLDLSEIINTGVFDREMDFAYARVSVFDDATSQDVSRVYLLARPHGGAWTALGYQDLDPAENCYLKLYVTSTNDLDIGYSCYNFDIKTLDENVLNAAIDNTLPDGFVDYDEESETYSTVFGGTSTQGGAQALPAKGYRVGGEVTAKADVTVTSYNAKDSNGALKNKVQSAGFGVRDEAGHYFNVGFDYQTNRILVHTTFLGDYARRIIISGEYCGGVSWSANDGVYSLPDSGVNYFNPTAYIKYFEGGYTAYGAAWKGPDYKYSLYARVTGDIFEMYIGDDQDSLVKLIELDMVKMFASGSALKLAGGAANATSLADQALTGNRVQIFASLLGDGAIEARFDNMTFDYVNYASYVQAQKNAIIAELDSYIAANINNNTLTSFAANNVNGETDGYTFTYNKSDLTVGSLLEGLNSLTLDSTAESKAALAANIETIRARSKERAMAAAFEQFMETAIVDLNAYATSRGATVYASITSIVTSSTTLEELETNFETAFNQLVIACNNYSDVTAFNDAVDAAIAENITSVYEGKSWYTGLNANAKADFDAEVDDAKSKIYGIFYDSDKTLDENIAALNSNPALAAANAQTLAAKTLVTSSYTVTIDKNGNTSDQRSCVYGSSVYDLMAGVAEPTKPDDADYSYEFSHWAYNNEEIDDSVYVKGDMTVVAMFAVCTATLNYSFFDSSTGNNVSVAWEITKDSTGQVVASGSGTSMNAQLGYGDFTIKTGVTATVYGSERSVRVDAAKVGTTDTQNINLDHNNVGANCSDPNAEYSGTSDATYTVHITSKDATFTPYSNKIKDHKGVKFSLTFNDAMTITDGAVNEIRFATTFGGLSLGFDSVGNRYNSTGTRMSYGLANLTHNIVNKLDRTVDLIYLRLWGNSEEGGNGYLLAKMSGDEEYSWISYAKFEDVASSNDPAQLILKLTGTAADHYDYTYSNFEFISNDSTTENLLDESIRNYYKLTPMPEDTTDFKMYYSTEYSGYGAYVDKTYDISEGVAEIKFSLKNTVAVSDKAPFFGFAMVDPATGNFLNIGFEAWINNYRDLRASLDTQNGWAYRYKLPVAGNVTGKTGSDLPNQNSSESLYSVFDLDFKALVNGDEWQLFLSKDGKALDDSTKTWMHSGVVNIKQWMSTHTPEGGYSWKGDAETKYPDASEVAFGVYTYDNSGGIDYSVSDFSVTYYTKSPITYVLDGGINNANNPASYSIFDSITLEDPYRDGYTFVGWVEGNTIELGSTGAKTFTAQWAEIGDTAYTINYYQQNAKDDGYTLVETLNLLGTEGAEVSAPIRNYAHFTCVDALVSGTITADGSLVLDVYFDRDVYTVTFVGNGGTLESGTAVQSVKYLGDAIAPTFARDGYDFTGFDADFTDVTGDITVTAQWTVSPDTVYAVEHYKQNVTGTGYTLAETEYFNGVTLETATAEAKSYFNYTCVTDSEDMTGTIAADGSLAIKIYYDYVALERKATGTTTFDMSSKSDVGEYVEDTYNINTGITEVSFRVTTTGSGSSQNFIGFVMVDSETGNFMNVGFQEHTAKWLRTSLINGNGYTYRWVHNPKGYPTNTQSNTPASISLSSAYDLDFKAVIDGDNWQLYFKQHNASTWEHTGVINFKASMANPSNQENSYKATWSGDAEYRYPSGNNMAFGVYVFDNSSFTTNVISDFNVSYTPKYKVEHYKQDVTGDGYTLAESEMILSEAGAEVTATAKTYDNFTCVTEDLNGTVAADGSLVIKVYYDRDTVTVTFNAGGGSLVSGDEVQSIRYEGDATAPVYTRNGYTFTGFDVDYTGVTANVTATAQWTPTEYGITYDLNGGTNNVANPATYTIESETITLAAPTREHYDFAGWTEGNTIAAGSYGDKTFTATWTATEYTITYVLNGGTNDVANPSTYTIESETITLANPTRTGYDFLGWAEGNMIAAGSYGNKTFTASWASNGDTAYTVKYYKQNFADDDYTLVETLPLSGATDEQVTAPARAYEHFHCVDSSVSGTVLSDGSLVLEVFFDLDTYTVTLDINGNTDTTFTVKYGTTIAMLNEAITPTKASDNDYSYEFAGWSYNTQMLDDDAFVEADITIVAEFTSTQRVSTLDYSFQDASNSNAATVNWSINKKSDGTQVRSGSGSSISTTLPYGEYTLTTDVTSTVYGSATDVSIDSAKLDNTDSKTISISHNNVGTVCDGTVEYSGTSDATYSVRITTGNTTFTPYYSLIDGEAIAFSLKFNDLMGYNLSGTVNEGELQKANLASTFGGLTFSVNYAGYRVKGDDAQFSRYAIPQFAHTIANELDITFDLIYARLYGNIYLFGKTSTDTYYSLLQYTESVLSKSNVVATDNRIALNLKITGTGDRKFDYTYSNFRVYSGTADYSELETIYSNRNLGPNYQMAAMPEGTEDFKLYYDSFDDGYGAYIDKTYDRTAGTTKITFTAKNTHGIYSNAPIAFFGLAMVDPATGNLLNIGFDERICDNGNSGRYMRASVGAGNGYNWRISFDQAGNVSGGVAMSMSSTSFYICREWEADFEVYVHGDEWVIYYTMKHYINASGGAEWIENYNKRNTGTIDIKKYFQNKTTMGSKGWSAVSEKYPSGDNVCFGVYAYSNGNSSESMDIQISDFTIEYTPDD